MLQKVRKNYEDCIELAENILVIAGALKAVLDRKGLNLPDKFTNLVHRFEQYVFILLMPAFFHELTVIEQTAG